VDLEIEVSGITRLMQSTQKAARLISSVGGKDQRMKEKRFSGKQQCGHCGNTAPMEIVGEYSQVRSYDDPRSGLSWEAGPVYEILLCPACHGVLFRRYYWHDMAIDPSEIEFKLLHPTLRSEPLGLPDPIQRAYEAAKKVRAIDVNAYGVLLGRLIELICEDRNAKGSTLAAKLKDLSEKGEIPTKLVPVADSLRNLRNIGAHPALGELTPVELPILDNLCKALVEYVYSAPYLVAQAEQRLQALKNKGALGS